MSLSPRWKYDVPHGKCISVSSFNKALKTETTYFSLKICLEKCSYFLIIKQP
jgi:hypothetical protein